MSRSRAREARSEPEASEVHQTGFTLLEVMAAVALLAILYTVLARVAIEGLRGEGESARRLEAALLADARIAESFTALSGDFVMPEFGHQETTEGDFQLALDVAPFQAPVEWGLDESSGTAPLLFTPPQPGVPASTALRTVQLTVSWLEGAETRKISRTIYLMDFNRISALTSAAEESGGRGAQTPEAPQSPEASELPELPSELEEP